MELWGLESHAELAIKMMMVVVVVTVASSFDNSKPHWEPYQENDIPVTNLAGGTDLLKTLHRREHRICYASNPTNEAQCSAAPQPLLLKPVLEYIKG